MNKTIFSFTFLILSILQLFGAERAFSGIQKASISFTKIRDWKDSSRLLLPGEKILSSGAYFITHASTEWNSHESIRDRVNQHIERAQEQGIPVIYLVHGIDTESLETYFLRTPPDFLVVSSVGEMELKLDVAHLFLAGGYFSYCAGQTARDLILYSQDNGLDTQLNYLTDSLYLSESERPSLKSVLSKLSDSEMLNFLQQHYFRWNRLGLAQNTPERHATFDEFTFDILRDGRQIGAFGHGPKGVRLNFIIETKPHQIMRNMYE